MKKEITRIIRIVPPKSVDVSYPDVVQNVTFENINEHWVTKDDLWEEYQIPKIKGFKADKNLVPEQQVKFDDQDQIIEVHYRSLKNEDKKKEKKIVEKKNESKKITSIVKHEEIKDTSHEAIKDVRYPQDFIPLSVSNAYLKDIPEVFENLKKLKRIGTITLTSKGYKERFFNF